MLKSYLKKIAKIANQGDAREESYYASLEELLGKLAQSFGKGKIHIRVSPDFSTTNRGILQLPSGGSTGTLPPRGHLRFLKRPSGNMG